MDRCEEVRALLSLGPDEVVSRAGGRLDVCENLDELYGRFADLVFSEIHDSAAAGRACRLILPVGPTGGYEPLLTRILDSDVSLAHCIFFFMDEYCDSSGNSVTSRHPLSFKGTMQEIFFARLNERLPPDKRPEIVFPDESNISQLGEVIRSAGGIDTCYGGIGIHGHVAFNEPGEGVATTGPRRVQLNDFTVTINAVRASVGGNLECFPRAAYTLGMEQILSSRRIVLFCRNGTGFDWANTVLRLALFGTPGDDYPVTHIRDRNYLVITDRDTLESPVNQL